LPSYETQIESLGSFLVRKKESVKKDWTWEVPEIPYEFGISLNENSDYSKNIELKLALHERIISENQRSIAEWFIKEWGGIKSVWSQTNSVHLI
jgi:hypothetical protein